MSTTITLAPAVDIASRPYMDVRVGSFDAGVAFATVYRTVKGRQFQVRGLFQAPVSGILTAQDYEAPVGVASSYQVAQYDSSMNFISYSAIVTATLPRLAAPLYAWIHNPLDPSTAVRVWMMSQAAQALSRPSTIEQFQIPGRSVGVALHGTRGGLTQAVLDCYCETDADVDKFDALFGGYDSDQSPILCIRTDPDLRLPPTLFAVVGSPQQNPFTDDPSGGGWWALTGDETSPPVSAFVVSLLSYADFSAFYSSYATFTAAYVDYATAQVDYSIEGTA
jgi:hypothetical protein